MKEQLIKFGYVFAALLILMLAQELTVLILKLLFKSTLNEFFMHIIGIIPSCAVLVQHVKITDGD